LVDRTNSGTNIRDKLSEASSRFLLHSGSGREPVRDWLKSLDLEDREDIKDVEFSWPIGMPLCRSLGKGLWEVRSALARGRMLA
jgi:hypothetical protein